MTEVRYFIVGLGAGALLTEGQGVYVTLYGTLALAVLNMGLHWWKKRQ